MKATQQKFKHIVAAFPITINKIRRESTFFASLNTRKSRSARSAEIALALLEASTQAQYFNVALQRWLALQLELLGGAMLLCVSLLCVYAREYAALAKKYKMSLAELAIRWAPT